MGILSGVLGFLLWFLLYIITIIIAIVRIIKGMGKRNFRAVGLMLMLIIASMFLKHSKILLVASWFVPMIAQWLFPNFFVNKNGGLLGMFKKKKISHRTTQAPIYNPKVEPATTSVPNVTVVPQITNITKSGEAPAYSSKRDASLGSMPDLKKVDDKKVAVQGNMSLEQELKVLDAKINNGDFSTNEELEQIVKRRRAIMDTLGL